MAKQAVETWGELRLWIWAHHYQFAASKGTVESVLKNLPIGDSYPLHMIDRGAVRRVVTELRQKQLSDATVRRYLTVLMKALREAHKEGFIGSVPALPTLPKQKRGRVRWLTAAEEKDMIAMAYEDTSSPRNFQSLLIFLMDTGLRLGEALALHWSEVEDGSITVLESKNGGRRKIPLTKRAERVLGAISLQPSENAGPFTDIAQYQVNRSWNRMKKAIGLEHDDEFVPHCLRHTFASRLVQRGAGLQVVMELMGHKRLENTMIYAHLAPAQHVAAVALLEQS